jgi:hypothetical protein
MQNITKTRELLAQVGFSCLEIAHGCERAQNIDFTERELEMMAIALFELHATVEKMLRSSLIHDGETLPSNDPPIAPLCKCGHERRNHMPTPLVTTSIAVATAAGCCIFCDCEGFDDRA